MLSGRGFKASFRALNLAVRYYDLHVAFFGPWRCMACHGVGRIEAARWEEPPGRVWDMNYYDYSSVARGV